MSEDGPTIELRMTLSRQGARDGITIIGAGGLFLKGLTPSHAVAEGDIIEASSIGAWVMDILAGRMVFEALFFGSCLAALFWIAAKIYLDWSRKRRAVWEGKSNLENILRLVSLGVIYFDGDGHVTAFNDTACRILAAGDRNREGLRAIEPGEHGEISKAIRESLAGRWQDREIELRGPDTGAVRPVLIRLLPLTVEGVIPKGGIILLEDLSERREEEKSLKDGAAKLRGLVEALPQAVFQTDSGGKLVVLNREAMHAFAIGQDRLDQGVSVLDLVVPQERERLAASLSGLSSGSETVVREEFAVLRPDGGTFPAVTFLSPIRRDGGVIGVGGLMVDISEFRLAEERLKTSLDQREARTRKIYHRVKNDLQILSSLIYLQSRHVEDREDIDILKDTENRILAMALVHETLYRSDAPDRLDLGRYIEDFVGELLSSYEEAALRLKVGIDVQVEPCGIDTAIPLGLIVNELVGNCIKKAAVASRRGELTVALRSLGDERLELTIAHDGIGPRYDHDSSGKDSLDLHVVKTLVGQLHGNMTAEGPEGNRLRIEFQEAGKTAPPAGPNAET